MSSDFGYERDFSPGGEAPVDNVRKVPLQRPPRLAFRLALGDLAGEEVAGTRINAGLDDCDPVQGGVELAVAAAIEAVVLGALA